MLLVIGNFKKNSKQTAKNSFLTYTIITGKTFSINHPKKWKAEIYSDNRFSDYTNSQNVIFK